jgi:DNA polymerase-3 subunit delta
MSGRPTGHDFRNRRARSRARAGSGARGYVRRVTLDELIRTARTGKVPALCVLTGGERVWIDRAIDALKAGALGEGPSGFNEDVFQGQGLLAGSVISVARTMPMMASRRFVLVRNLDAMAVTEQESLAAYLAKPSPDACVVLVGEKLDGRSKLARAARDAGVLFEAEPPKPYQIPEIAQREARARGHALSGDAAGALSDALGTDLSALDDALERLSLFVGEGKAIELPHVEQCVAHVRTESIWSLVDAVSARDAKTALTAAASLLGDREPPLKILALVVRQLRMVAKMRDALASGLGPQEAAQKAGAAPFKARELGAAAKRFDDASLAKAFRLVAEADIALKGSKVPGPRVLERTLLELCS